MAQESSQRPNEHVGEVEQILGAMAGSDDTDTVMALMEVYESVERSYRAAVLAGEVHPRVAQSTNY